MYKQLKLTARKKLSGGNLCLCVGAVLVSFLVLVTSNYLGYLAVGILGLIFSTENLLLSSFVYIIISAAAFFLLSPILLGCFKIFFLVASGERPKLFELFSYIDKEQYQKALCFNFFLIIKLLARFVISYSAVAAAILLFVLLSLGTVVPPILVLFILSILTVLGIFLFLFLSSTLLYAPVSFMKFNDLPVLYHFHCSKEICKKSSVEILLFFMSFLPWLFLSCFIIPLLWTIPYIFVTSIVLGISLEKRYTDSEQSEKQGQNTAEQCENTI